MGYAVRERDCSGCGIRITGRFPLTKPVWCLECNLDRAKNAAQQMAAKSGPYYDQWLQTRGPQGRPRR